MEITKTRTQYTVALIVSVLLSAGCASTAEEQDADAEQFAAEVDRRLDSDPNKRTCRTFRPTGSMLGERVCKSNAEWDAIEEESRAAIKAIQRDQSINPGSGD
jgi:hypothetical protein